MEQQVGARLKEARVKKHWTQAKAAKELRVSLNTVSAWERGKANPYAYNQERIYEVYGLSAEDLGLIERQPPPLVSPPGPQVTQHLQTFIRQDLTMHLWSLASQPYRAYQDVHAAMARILKDYNQMTPKNLHINRREALCRLVSLSFVAPAIVAALKSEETPPATVCQDIMAQCAVSIAACWELRKSAEYSDLALAFEGVSTYLPILQRIVRDSSQHRQEAASLATQCLLLKAILGKHLEGTVQAIPYAQQALSYSKVTQDISLHLKGLEVLAHAQSMGRQYQLARQTIGQAEPLLKRVKDKKLPVSPYALALANGMLACMLARTGQDGTATLDQAITSLPEKDMEHPVFVGYNQGELLLDMGIVYTHQGENAKAIEALSQAVDPQTFVLKKALRETDRVQVINTMTMASLKAKEKNMEQSIHFWRAGIQAAKALHSEPCFNEAVAAYDIMEAIWPHEKHIRELRELTEHW